MENKLAPHCKDSDIEVQQSALSQARRFRLRIYEILLPLILTISLLPFAQTIDISMSSLSYDSSTAAFHPPSWCRYVYVWGLMPGQLLFFGASLITLAGLISRRARTTKLWVSSTYLFFVLSIGSGAIAHGVFKGFFKRPRPKQVHEFGGAYPYSKPYLPYTQALMQPNDRLRSMPSGHATMGFYFFALWFLGKRFSRPFLRWMGMVLGVGLGSLLTMSRILEGGHFFTDGLAAFFIMWYTSLILDLLWKGSHSKASLSIDNLEVSQEVS